jgi:hypothetical protein
MFKLAERRGGRDGLYCGCDGVYLGPAALIERREGRYWLRAEDEVAQRCSPPRMKRRPMLCTSSPGYIKSGQLSRKTISAER